MYAYTDMYGTRLTFWALICGWFFIGYAMYARIMSDKGKSPINDYLSMIFSVCILGLIFAAFGVFDLVPNDGVPLYEKSNIFDETYAHTIMSPDDNDKKVFSVLSNSDNYTTYQIMLKPETLDDLRCYFYLKDTDYECILDGHTKNERIVMAYE